MVTQIWVLSKLFYFSPKVNIDESVASKETANNTMACGKVRACKNKLEFVLSWSTLKYLKAFFDDIHLGDDIIRWHSLNSF